MVGCFGNSKEDRAMANELNRHLKQEEEAEMRAARIDAMADDLYLAKLSALPTTRKGARFVYTLIGDSLGELDSDRNQDDMIALGKAIRENNDQEAGRLIIKLVTGQLRYEAEYEAENDC